MDEDDKLLLKLALVGPRANLNGTSKKELLDQYIDALKALLAAQEALAKMAPHGRDYQTLPDGQFDIAVRQHRARRVLLAGVMNEITVLAEEFATS